MAEESVETVDKISALPQPILQHILSFLPLKQVAQTSILSKTWQRSWKTFPVLKFDNNFFKRDYSSKRTEEATMILLNLLHYVEKILRNHHQETINITHLSLDLTYIFDHVQFPSIVRRCIGYAIGCNAKELKLVYVYHPSRYILDPMVLSAESVRVLDLTGIILTSPSSTVKLFSLRKLYLTFVYAGDGVIETIIDGCPLIEDLYFRDCRGFTTLKLSGDRLHRIDLHGNEKLQRLVLKAINLHSVFIRYHIRLREINIAECKNIKSLSFSLTPITDEWLRNQISKFPHLEDLVLCDCYTLRRIKISSSSLKRLDIGSCIRLVEVKLETPNLSIFNYKGDLISFSLDDDSTLPETNLCLFSKNSNTQWYFNFIELLVKFHSLSKVLNLKCQRGENVIFPVELRQTTSPLVRGLEHFKLIIENSPLCAAVKNIVDGLLWISPHAKTLSIKTTYFSFELEFSYKEEPIYEGEIAAQCCKLSIPLSCWEQCIEQVEIKFISRKLEKTCIFEGEGIWEQMDHLNKLVDLVQC